MLLNAGGQERKIVPEKPNNAGGQERKVNSKKTLDSSDSTREVKDTSESNNLQKGDEQKQQVTEQELTLEQEKSKRLEAGLKNMERTGVYNGPESGVMYLPEEKISNILEKNTVTNTQDIITNGKEDIRPTNSNDAPVPYDDIKADIDAMFAESAKTRQEQENLIVKPTDKKVKAVEQPKLSIEQQDAIKDYQDEFSVNTKLRNGKALDNPLYKDQIKLIDEAIDNSNPLTDEATVYRSVHTKNSKGKEYEFWTKLKKDGQMTDPAYMSTGKSWSDNTSQFIDNGVTNGETYTLRIKLPKGTKGIDVGQRVWDGVSSGYGDEFLLPRNSTIKLNSIDEANKLAECEYVLPDMSKAEL